MLLEIICIACKSCGEDKQATSDSHVSTSEELTFEGRIFLNDNRCVFPFENAALNESEFSINSLRLLQFHPYVKKKKKDITGLS